MRRHPKKGGQFAIIWVDLLYEDAVPATGKLLFGEIYRLSGPDGWCDASNQDFMDLLGCSETTVRNLLKALEDVGHISGGHPAPPGRLRRHRAVDLLRPETVPSGSPGGTRKKLRVPRGGYPQKFEGGTRRNLRVHIYK